jgi:Xaa-Pro aminopeptidase
VKPPYFMVPEFDIKRDRLARVCHEASLTGIVITTQANFAWLTGGRTNRIDGSRELGAGSLLVGADGRVHLLANAIEMPRLAGEELSHLTVSPVEYPWTDDHTAPDTLVRLAKQVLGGNAAVGADWALPGATPVDRDIARARAPLTEHEVERYRGLGHDVGHAIERTCGALQPGLEEQEIARRATDSVAAVGARAIVALVAADERIARFRHPVPTPAAWRKSVLVAVCAERHGLVVAITRIVSAGGVDADLAQRTRATAGVFGALLDATRDGVTGASLFGSAADAYARAGFAGEERKHHQGGATGYRAREWVAHPASEVRVRAPQAFAWNPSITGTKVEDTAVVTDSGIELVTMTGEWPTIPIEVGARRLAAADVLSI